MSGEIVVFAAAKSSVLYRAVAQLAAVAPDLPDLAVIGGLAVMARLGQAHRVTNDVDTVSDDQLGVLAVLVADGFERRGDSALRADGLKLDVIDVSEGDTDYVPFATHRFAFDTRTPVKLVARPADDGEPVEVVVDVARASALVAMKLGISEGVGRPRDTNKVGSDAFDAVRLLQLFGPDMLADDLLTMADRVFTQRISELVALHLIDSADRTAAAITRSAVQGVQTVSAETLELLGRAFVGRLRRA